MSNSTKGPNIDSATTSEMHAPELYAVADNARPYQGLATLDATALQQYEQNGFLAVEQALSEDEVESAKQGITDLILRGHERGASVMIEAAGQEQWATLGADKRMDLVRRLFGFCAAEPRLAAVAHHPAILWVVRRIIGGEPRCFQEMALLKPPHIGREKPWHQDAAYFDFPPGTKVVGVWIALDAATVENGCMHVLPGTHLHGPTIHFKRRDWQICDKEILGKRCVAVPLAPGGLMLFDGLLHHGTPHNHSPYRRRALQFHYCQADVQPANPSPRMTIFGSEGKDVTC